MRKGRWPADPGLQAREGGRSVREGLAASGLGDAWVRVRAGEAPGAGDSCQLTALRLQIQESSGRPRALRFPRKPGYAVSGSVRGPGWLRGAGRGGASPNTEAGGGDPGRGRRDAEVPGRLGAPRDAQLREGAARPRRPAGARGAAARAPRRQVGPGHRREVGAAPRFRQLTSPGHLPGEQMGCASSAPGDQTRAHRRAYACKVRSAWGAGHRPPSPRRRTPRSGHRAGRQVCRFSPSASPSPRTRSAPRRQESH
jgi:hypothetical protein